MGMFDGFKKNSKVLAWAREQVTKMSSNVADAIRSIFTVKWSYSARRDALAYLELFHTTPRLDPVDIIATDCANTPFKVFNKIDLRMGREDAEPVYNHPVYDLLDNPIPSRPDFDGFTLRYLTHVWVELQGDCYWIIVKDVRDIPREIYPIPSNWVVSAPTISIPYFLVLPQGNTASQTLLIAPENVVWFKNPNVAQPYARGRGRAEAIGDEIESDEYAAKYLKNFFFNDATPRSVITAPGANDNSIKQLKESWNQQFQGFNNASKTGFLGWDAKLLTLSTTPKEGDFTQTRNMFRDMTDQHYQMPPEMRGILDNSNRSTIDSAFYLYAKNVMLKRLMRFDSMVNRQLMPMWDDKYQIKCDNVVPEDKEFALTVANAGWTGGTITRGEWRVKVGMKKLGNALDDQIKTDLNYVPINVGAANTGAALDESGEDQQSGDNQAIPPKVPQDTPLPAVDEPLPAQPIEYPQTNGTPGLTPPSKGFSKSKKKSYSDEIRVKIWNQIDKAATVNEDPFRKAIKKMANSQQAKFNAIFNAKLDSGMNPTSALDQAVNEVFGDAEDAAVKKELYSSWLGAMKTGQGVAEALVDASVSSITMQSVFRDWIEEFGLEKAKEINDTTIGDLRKSLSDGLANGESTLELQDRMDSEFDGLRDYRTERIARTESIASLNFGASATYKSSGIQKKEWLAVQDDRTRLEHDDADGQVVGIDEPFVVGGEELMYPGDPTGSAENIINCRCSLLPVIEDEGEE